MDDDDVFFLGAAVILAGMLRPAPDVQTDIVDPVHEVGTPGVATDKQIFAAIINAHNLHTAVKYRRKQIEDIDAEKPLALSELLKDYKKGRP